MTPRPTKYTEQELEDARAADLRVDIECAERTAADPTADPARRAEMAQYARECRAELEAMRPTADAPTADAPTDAEPIRIGRSFATVAATFPPMPNAHKLADPDGRYPAAWIGYEPPADNGSRDGGTYFETTSGRALLRRYAVGASHPSGTPGPFAAVPLRLTPGLAKAVAAGKGLRDVTATVDSGDPDAPGGPRSSITGAAVRQCGSATETRAEPDARPIPPTAEFVRHLRAPEYVATLDAGILATIAEALDASGAAGKRSGSRWLRLEFQPDGGPIRITRAGGAQSGQADAQDFALLMPIGGDENADCGTLAQARDAAERYRDALLRIAAAASDETACELRDIAREALRDPDADEDAGEDCAA